MDKVYSINEIRSQLIPIFKTAPIYKAILFGSYATGKATTNSDVDIVIDSNGELLNIQFYGISDFGRNPAMSAETYENAMVYD